MAAEPAGRRRVAVAVSGGGRSLANLLACQRPGLGYEVAAVIASRPTAGGTDIARARGLPLFIGDFSPGALADTAVRLSLWLAAQPVGWVALAGFLKLFPVAALGAPLADRVVNIHPALLPSHGGPGMYGDRVHAAVLAAGVAESGATVHWVNGRYDEGSVIAQITVPVRPDDTVRALADRVFTAECALYPAVLDRLVTGALPLPGGQIERLRHDPR